MAERWEFRQTGWMGRDGRLHSRMRFEPNLAAERPTDPRPVQGASAFSFRRAETDGLKEALASLRHHGVRQDSSKATEEQETPTREIILDPISEPRRVLFAETIGGQTQREHVIVTPYNHEGTEFDVIQREDHEGPVTVTQSDDNGIVINGDKIKIVELGKKDTPAENQLTFVIPDTAHAHTVVLKEGHTLRIRGLVARVFGNNGTIIIEDGGTVLGNISPDLTRKPKVGDQGEVAHDAIVGNEQSLITGPGWDEALAAARDADAPELEALAEIRDRWGSIDAVRAVQTLITLDDLIRIGVPGAENPELRKLSPGKQDAIAATMFRMFRNAASQHADLVDIGAVALLDAPAAQPREELDTELTTLLAEMRKKKEANLLALERLQPQLGQLIPPHESKQVPGHTEGDVRHIDYSLGKTTRFKNGAKLALTVKAGAAPRVERGSALDPDRIIVSHDKPILQLTIARPSDLLVTPRVVNMAVENSTVAAGVVDNGVAKGKMSKLYAEKATNMWLSMGSQGTVQQLDGTAIVSSGASLLVGDLQGTVIAEGTNDTRTKVIVNTVGKDAVVMLRKHTDAIVGTGLVRIIGEDGDDADSTVNGIKGLRPGDYYFFGNDQRPVEAGVPYISRSGRTWRVEDVPMPDLSVRSRPSEQDQSLQPKRGRIRGALQSIVERAWSAVSVPDTENTVPAQIPPERDAALAIRAMRAQVEAEVAAVYGGIEPLPVPEPRRVTRRRQETAQRPPVHVAPYVSDKNAAKILALIEQHRAK